MNTTETINRRRSLHQRLEDVIMAVARRGDAWARYMTSAPGEWRPDLWDAYTVACQNMHQVELNYEDAIAEACAAYNTAHDELDGAFL